MSLKIKQLINNRVFFSYLKHCGVEYTEKNTGVYLKKTVVELTKFFIKTQPTTLVVELMNKIRKSHFVINLTNLFVNITKKIHYVNDAAFVDLTHLFVNPTKNFYKIFFF